MRTPLDSFSIMMDIYRRNRGKRSRQHTTISSFERLAATDCHCIRHSGIPAISSYRLCIASPKSSYKHAILREFARGYSPIRYSLMSPDTIDYSIFGHVKNPNNIHDSSILRCRMNTTPASELLYSSRLLSNLYYRQLPTAPDRVLDAPGMVDDFYLDLIDWSKHNNIISVALGSCVYLWNAQTSITNELVSIDPDGHYISAIQWNKTSYDPSLLAFGTSSGTVQLWNTEKESLLSTFQHPLHSIRSDEVSFPFRISSICWNGSNLLSYGRRDGLVFHNDVRISSPTFQEYHKQEVCGLAWSPCGTQLALGGNDNLLTIWDNRKFDRPLHKIQDHTAAVKALAWSPNQRRILASGGGTADKTIRIWNTTSGYCYRKVTTNSQVTGLLWTESNARTGELVSSHGYSENQITVWRAPSLTKLGDMRGHHGRVLCISSSPDDKNIVSAGADERLCFWSINNERKSIDDTSTIKRDDCIDNGFIPKTPRSSIKSLFSSISHLSISPSTPKFKPLTHDHIQTKDYPFISPIIPKYHRISCKINDDIPKLILIR